MDNHKAKSKPQGGAAAAGVVIVQVLEEKRTSDAALLLPRRAGVQNPSLLIGYDRRQLLLDYARQLRRIDAQQAPTWAKWKAERLHADREMLMIKRNPPSWIHRLWGRIRRRRGQGEAAAPPPPSPATVAGEVETRNGNDFESVPLRK